MIAQRIDLAMINLLPDRHLECVWGIQKWRTSGKASIATGQCLTALPPARKRPGGDDPSECCLYVMLPRRRHEAGF
jgi:hypothetical protein